MTARTRVERLVGLHGLEPGATDRLLALLELLARDPAAPSSVRDPERAAEVHIADSLSVLELPEVARAGRVVDVGSGAGFPGLPLAIARPHAGVVLLESSRRKCDFLGRALTVTGAANARVVCSRAEAWAEGRGWAELVVARALGELALVGRPSRQHAAGKHQGLGHCVVQLGGQLSTRRFLGRDQAPSRQVRASLDEIADRFADYLIAGVTKP